MAERSEACTVFSCLNIGTVCSIPTHMDVCLHFPVLCCPVLVEALHWANPPFKESYQMSKQIFKFQKINSEPEQAKRPNP
jgi:hypothetical protein